MNSVILSAFVGILLVACVQSQNDSECNLKCRNGEYCYRRVLGRLALETCMRYRRKGALCNDDLWKCNPEQDCKPKRQGSSLRYCQDKSETTTSGSTTMTMTMPTTPTMMTTDVPTVTTDIPKETTDIPTVTTDIPKETTDIPTVTTDIPTETTDMPSISTDMSTLSTSMPTDMSTDIPTVATDETTAQ